MAHVGKPFPYLFERDFSLRYVDSSFRALAKKYRTASYSWSNALVSFSGSFQETAEGVANYDTRRVVYNLVPTIRSPANLNVDLVYALTNDLFFFKWVIEVKLGSTVAYRGEEVRQAFTPLTWFPNALCQPVPPQPGGPLAVGFTLFPVGWPP